MIIQFHSDKPPFSVLKAYFKDDLFAFNKLTYILPAKMRNWINWLNNKMPGILSLYLKLVQNNILFQMSKVFLEKSRILKRIFLTNPSDFMLLLYKQSNV